MLLELSRWMVDDSSTISPTLCSVGDVGRQAAAMPTGRERLLSKEARMRRQRKCSHPVRALFRKLQDR